MLLVDCGCRDLYSSRIIKLAFDDVNNQFIIFQSLFTVDNWLSNVLRAIVSKLKATCLQACSGLFGQAGLCTSDESLHISPSRKSFSIPPQLLKSSSLDLSYYFHVSGIRQHSTSILVHSANTWNYFLLPSFSLRFILLSCTLSSAFYESH